MKIGSNFLQLFLFLRPTLDDLLGIARCNGQRRSDIMSNITDGHIQGLFLLKGNPIGPLDLIKKITDLLGQGDHFFF